MLRDILVAIHAGAGVLGLLAGLWSLAPPQPGQRARRWVRRAYQLCIAVLVVSLLVLVAVDWPGLDTGARVAFAGLTGLGVFMLYRLVSAEQTARRRPAGWQRRYLGHLYFTYVALWIGFLVIPALNLPLPMVGVPLTVVAVLLIGGLLRKRYERRLAIGDAVP